MSISLRHMKVNQKKALLKGAEVEPLGRVGKREERL